MKSKKIKYILIMFLLFLESISVYLTHKSYEFKDISKEKEEIKVNKKQFAMYIENDTGIYEEYTTSEIFPVGYKLNLDKSSCTDTNGNIIEGMLSSIDNKVTITSNKTTYCYLYFDKKYSLSELCTSGDNLGSCLTTNNSEIESLSNDIQGDMYRYQGTNDIVTDNYICFGTTDSSECTSNTDTYMYRIIGVNESGQLKLIKKEALNTVYTWNSSSEVTWPESELYNGLNGNYYLSNSTYMPTGWSNKISDYTWKYGDVVLWNITAINLYLIENEWLNSISSKIGLMHMYDYYYSYQNGGLNCSYVSGFYGICKSSWLHLSNSDINVLSTAEWLMDRNENTYPWYISGNGYVSVPSSLESTYSVRPVFYLNNDELYVSGNGTLKEPIIIS